MGNETNFATIAALGLAGILPFILVAVVLLYVYRLIHDKITPFDDVYEANRGNLSAGLSRGGAYLGVIVALSGSLLHAEGSYAKELGMFALDGVIAVVFFTVASYAFDYVILRHVDNSSAIEADNKAVAIAEASGFVSLGIIMCASFSGGGQSLWAGMLSAIMFSTVGLGTLMAIYVVYGLLWTRRANCRVDEEIGDGNLAAGIDAGTLLLAMSVTLWFSISGEFEGWGTDIASYAVAAVSSILAVSMGRGIALLTLAYGLTTTRDGVHHGNVTKSIMVGLVGIGFGLIAGLVTFV